jgi:hypothetical protein
MSDLDWKVNTADRTGAVIASYDHFRSLIIEGNCFLFAHKSINEAIAKNGTTAATMATPMRSLIAYLRLLLIRQK